MMKTTLEVKRRTKAGMKSEVSFSEDHAEGMHWSRFKDKEINCEHIFEKKPFLQEIAYGTTQKL